MSFASKILSGLKRLLGMKNALLLFGSSDKIPLRMVEFFMKHDLPIMETYGLTECTGFCQLNTMADWRLGSSGRSMNGTRVKIDNPDRNGIGEVMQMLCVCIFINPITVKECNLRMNSIRSNSNIK